MRESDCLDDISVTRTGNIDAISNGAAVSISGAVMNSAMRCNNRTPVRGGLVVDIQAWRAAQSRTWIINIIIIIIRAVQRQQSASLWHQNTQTLGGSLLYYGCPVE